VWLSASGRPVFVQDTGFGKHFPIGEGLLTFTTLGERCRASSRSMQITPRTAWPRAKLAEDKSRPRRFCIVLDRAGVR